eukprot:SAG31_NODE_1206_length_9388_cov_7.855420_1_plen_211_part_10
MQAEDAPWPLRLSLDGPLPPHPAHGWTACEAVIPSWGRAPPGAGFQPSCGHCPPPSAAAQRVSRASKDAPLGLVLAICARSGPSACLAQVRGCVGMADLAAWVAWHEAEGVPFVEEPPPYSEDVQADFWDVRPRWRWCRPPRPPPPHHRPWPRRWRSDYRRTPGVDCWAAPAQDTRRARPSLRRRSKPPRGLPRPPTCSDGGRQRLPCKHD